MKIAIKYKKHNYTYECNEIQVCEDFRYYMNIDDYEYRINNHEFLKEAISDERVDVYERDYVMICLDSMNYILGPFVDDENLITKDIVDAINMVIYRQFKDDVELIKLDLEEVLDGVEEFKKKYDHSDISYQFDLEKRV